MHKQPSVYMLASKRNDTLYIGMTSNLLKFTWKHRNDLAEGFRIRQPARAIDCDVVDALPSSLRTPSRRRAGKLGGVLLGPLRAG